MNPILLAIIAGASAAIPILIAVINVGGPFGREWLKNHVEKQQLQRLHDSLRGVAKIVSAVAAQTPGFKLDDGFAMLLDVLAIEVGKAVVEKYGSSAIVYAATLHADAGLPQFNLGAGEVNSALKNAIDTRRGTPVAVREAIG